ncbi:MAG TPA: diacylglycerol kinase [Jatrophihabitantaceae bacterium]|nr:diacylglycerol kinase [Jatrophihabitantaceae bacterium]
MTRIAVLVNPAAGGGRGARVAHRAVARLRERGLDVEELAGTDARHAAALAQDAVGSADVLAVVGGDGMISIALQVLAGTEVPLGIVPAGSGNDHARTYGIPRRSAEKAADVIADGHRTTVDIGRIVAADGETRYFGTVVAAGFDSLVNDRANRMRRPRGRMRYNLATVVELANLRRVPFRVEVDDDRFNQDLVLAAVGNAPTYGGGMRICPEADAADGLLDVTVVRAMPRRRLVRFFPSVYTGTLARHHEVEMYRAATVRLDARGIRAYADGELVGSLPVEVTVVPRALRILTPAASRT